MGRKPRVDRSPEEKWQIVQQGIKSGKVSKTCRRHGIAANLFYRWKAVRDMAVHRKKVTNGNRSVKTSTAECQPFADSDHYATFSTGLQKILAVSHQEMQKRLKRASADRASNVKD